MTAIAASLLIAQTQLDLLTVHVYKVTKEMVHSVMVRRVLCRLLVTDLINLAMQRVSALARRYLLATA